MRLNRINISLLIAVLAMSLQSCLKDQEDIFDQPSTVRMQEYLDNAKSVLTSAENGWLFDYIPDRNYSYGGILYSLEFTDSNVTAGCVLAPGEYETSLYKLTNDNGPSLSFDSYNWLIHYFATPWGSSGGYEAMDGDFEFMIMDVTDDVITLRGKRTGNTMYMRRADKDVKQCMKEIARSADDQFFTQATGSIGGQAATAFIDIDVNYFEIAFDDKPGEYYGEYYYPTATGLRFMSPIEIEGAQISTLDFTMDKVNNCGVYSGSTSAGAAINFSASLPANYAFLSEFDGEFTFKFGATSVDVTLVPDYDKKTVTFKGISPKFDLVASYSKGMGCLDLQTQEIVSDCPYPMLLTGDVGGGSIVPAPGGAGVFFIKDLENPGQYKAVPDNCPRSADCNGNFLLIMVKDAKYYIASSPYLIAGGPYVTGVTAIVKK